MVSSGKGIQQEFTILRSEDSRVVFTLVYLMLALNTQVNQVCINVSLNNMLSDGVGRWEA